jgi:predicted acetyltransferase
MKTETRGRKTIPKETKKIPVCIYLQAQEIEQLGGMVNLRNELTNYSKTKANVTNNYKGLHESRN